MLKQRLVMSVLAAMLVLSVSASALVIDSEVTWDTRTTIDDIEIVAGGHLIANARVDMGDGGATLTLNGGTFTSNDHFKFPSDWGPAELYFNSGTWYANDIEMIDRTPHGFDLSVMVMDDGARLELLQQGIHNTTLANYQVKTWLDSGMLVAADGAFLVFEDFAGSSVDPYVYDQFENSIVVYAIPEPATMGLLGLGGLALLRKRKQG